MKRQILVFSGLFILFLLFGLSSKALATHYKVKNGDTLYSISKKFNVSVNEIKKANNLRKLNIKTNQLIKIAQNGSSKSIPVKKNTSSCYIVKKGDSLFKIAQKNHVPLKKLIALNNNLKTIRAGQKIVLAKAISQPQEKTTISSENQDEDTDKTIPVKKNTSSYYIVKKGDSLSKIAQKNHVPLKKLIALNNNSKTIRAGQKIVLANSTSRPKKQTNFSENQDEDLIEETNEEVSAVADKDTDIEEESDDGEDFFSSAYRFISGEEFLGKWKSSNEMQRLIKKATGFLGVRYRLGGNSKRGIDCSALVQKVYRSFNVSLPRVARDQSEVGVEVDPDELVKGDLVFFNTNRSYGHVGIYIGNNKFIHASSRSRRVRIDSMNHPYYQERFQRAVRIKELPLGG